MKVIYMGTPDFSVPPLEKLIENGYDVCLVVTQPDKEKGRGREVSMSPVKMCALKHNIPVFQPVKIREEEAVKTLRSYGADIFVVAAFGQIVSEEILNMPKYGCINIHASLLPKYRGAAPIQWSILDGEEYTGVTIMKMAKGVDTGDIYSSTKVKIEDDETGDSLFDKLTLVGADLLIDTLPKIEDGSLAPIPQDEALATHTSKISKELGLIDWNKEASVIERYIRGLNSWPSAYTYLDKKTLKIWRAKVVDITTKKNVKGSVIEVKKDSFTVSTGDYGIEILEIQLEGKKRMRVHDFLLGYKIEVGTILG
ncbi:MAG: methionyl-tRNA formyltransferase [Lachnospiraceae bacterium]|nr:methionyl-tRNA formyltransferase [Lachnospiraceae bacterium]